MWLKIGQQVVVELRLREVYGSLEDTQYNIVDTGLRRDESE